MNSELREKETFGTFVKSVQKSRNLSQRELGNLLGVSNTTIYLVETGKQDGFGPEANVKLWGILTDKERDNALRLTTRKKDEEKPTTKEAPDEPDLKVVGEYFAYLRKKTGKGMPTLADKAGTDIGTLRKLENGEEIPPEEVIEKLIHYLRKAPVSENNKGMTEEEEEVFRGLLSGKLREIPAPKEEEKKLTWQELTRKDDLASVFKGIRLHRNMSQMDVARATNISPGTLCNIEHGNGILSDTSMKKMVSGLKLTDYEKEKLGSFVTPDNRRRSVATWDGIIHTEDLGAFIKSIRLRSGMSAKTLNKKTGISSSTISYLEKGAMELSEKTAKKLAETPELNFSEEEKHILFGFVAKKQEKKDTKNIAKKPEFGPYLKSLIKKKRTTSDDLAQKIGTSGSYIRKIEGKNIIPREDRVLELAEALNLSDEELDIFLNAYNVAVKNKETGYTEKIKASAKKAGYDKSSPHAYLKSVRERKGIKQKDLADLIGTHVTSVSKLERGYSNVLFKNTEKREKYMSALKMTERERATFLKLLNIPENTEETQKMIDETPAEITVMEKTEENIVADKPEETQKETLTEIGDIKNGLKSLIVGLKSEEAQIQKEIDELNAQIEEKQEELKSVAKKRLNLVKAYEAVGSLLD